MKTSRTVNPLHFEDLEPHRFEDLVRQLVYDFRPWHLLEATGRTGSDEGIDILGVERVRTEFKDDELSEEGEQDLASVYEDRIWVIQCKREKSIPPGKMRTIVAASLRSFEEPPYGFILAAATDFSLKARDAFRQEMREHGIEEFLLWGKAELEDRLFEPRHDHLLFAYFGFSLQTRRRSARSVSISRLTTKRRLVKHLGEIDEVGYKVALLRDAESVQYPMPLNPEAFRADPLWRYYRFAGHLRVDQLAFVVREYWAWIKPEEGKWDAADEFDQGSPSDPVLFCGPQRRHETEDEEEQTRRFWLTQIPGSERAHLRSIGFVHYDRVVAIDDVGDRFNPPPHLLLACARTDELFDDIVDVVEQGSGNGHRLWRLQEIERVALFPSPVPRMTFDEFSSALEKSR